MLKSETKPSNEVEERQVFKGTKYAEKEIMSFEDTGKCAIARCNNKSSYRCSITIRGRHESACFCDTCFPLEAYAESMYKQGM